VRLRRRVVLGPNRKKVNKTTYDETIEILGNAVKQARVRSKERINAIKRLQLYQTKMKFPT